jgi:RNA 2',3'-cyclic 3'-phosphodiesterase
MSVIRAFIAIDIDPEILKQLGRITSDLKQMTDNRAMRWVSYENIHLTLKFLGDVSLNNLDLLKDALISEVSTHKQFNLSVGTLGAFPKPRNPRIIWVGVEGADALINLQRTIDSRLTRLGYEKEDREFAAHLTLGRISRSARPEEIRTVSLALERYKVGFLGITPVNQVHLYRSDLYPDGAVYTRLISAKLSD